MMTFQDILKNKTLYALLIVIYVMNSAMTYDQQLRESRIIDASVEEVVDFAKLHLGKPYKYAAKGPHAFDCSGFTYFVFKNFEVRLPASSRRQSLIGESIDLDDLAIGDLLFFESPDPDNHNVGHVGMVTKVEDGSIRFIHSSTSRGVVIDDLRKSQHYASRYLGARRIL